MSKLQIVRQYRYGRAAGGLFSFVPKLLGGAINAASGLNIFKSKSAAIQSVASPAPASVFKSAAANPLLAGYGGGGRTVRRGKGITHNELRGYRKVANLIHKEGMVSKRARGRKA